MPQWQEPVEAHPQPDMLMDWLVGWVGLVGCSFVLGLKAVVWWCEGLDEVVMKKKKGRGQKATSVGSGDLSNDGDYLML